MGWTPHETSRWEEYAALGFTPGRVCAVERGSCRIWTSAGEARGEVSGRFRHEALTPADFPVTGDWVALRLPEGEGNAIIEAVVPRRTQVVRRAPGAAHPQVLVANTDVAWLVTGLDGDFNLRRLERYAEALGGSGIELAIVLTKSDLAPDGGAAAADDAAGLGLPIHRLSSLTGEGIAALEALLAPGQTLVLLGSSGAGKSTLTNRLMGAEVQRTAEVRGDDSRGRHTTTGRELFVLPNGALLIDTAGLREFQIWEGGDTSATAAFPEIAALLGTCRFADCLHQQEPGCAIRAALESGTLDAVRWESYQKLLREREFAAAQVDPALERARQKKWKTITKTYRANPKLRD